mmetsp:Transcript_17079/g.40760  ORF Transcript_17079/g.40760 Transcript_17079/m.40760 type:complete len:261 (-) Transcript_17079:119-901(-)
MLHEPRNGLLAETGQTIRILRHSSASCFELPQLFNSLQNVCTVRSLRLHEPGAHDPLVTLNHRLTAVQIPFISESIQCRCRKDEGCTFLGGHRQPAERWSEETCLPAGSRRLQIADELCDSLPAGGQVRFIAHDLVLQPCVQVLRLVLPSRVARHRHGVKACLRHPAEHFTGVRKELVHGRVLLVSRPLGPGEDLVLRSVRYPGELALQRRVDEGVALFVIQEAWYLVDGGRVVEGFEVRVRGDGEVGAALADGSVRGAY